MFHFQTDPDYLNTNCIHVLVQMEQNTGLGDLVSAAAMGDVESHGH